MDRRFGAPGRPRSVYACKAGDVHTASHRYHQCTDPGELLVSLFTIKRYQGTSVAFAGTLIKGISGIIIAILALVLLFTSSQSTSHLMLKILAGQAVLASLILCIEVFAIKKSAYRKKPLLLEALGSVVVAVLVFLLPLRLLHSSSPSLRRLPSSSG